MDVSNTCGSIHEGHEWFNDLDYSRWRVTRDFWYVWLFYCVSNCADSRTEVPRRRSSQSYFMRSFFLSQCIQQQWSVRQNYFHWEKTSDCSLLVSGRKERKLWSQHALACFMLKATSVIIHRILLPRLRRYSVANSTGATQPFSANHNTSSEQKNLSSFISDQSISQPVELDNLIIEWHVLLMWKKSLQSYCSVDFDFIALKRLDMTFDVALHNDSSFIKLTNSWH